VVRPVRTRPPCAPIAASLMRRSIGRWMLTHRLSAHTLTRRYEERLPHSTLEGQDYAEDQIADVIANPTDTSNAGRQPERLWREDDEEYYNDDRRSSPLI
jgi:hypothetical protein